MVVLRFLFLLFACITLHAWVYAQQTGNSNMPSAALAQNITVNARTLDSLHTIHTATRNGRLKNFEQQFAGAQLVPQKNKAVYNKLQQQVTAGPLATNKAFSLLQQNAVCYTISGRNFLKQDSLVLYTNDACKTRDGNVLVTGEFGEYTPYLVESGAYCMKTDIEGNVLWAKLYDSVEVGGSDYTYYSRVIELADGSILLAGRTKNRISGNDDFVLTKLDTNGNLIWLKTYEARLWQGFNGSGDSFPLTDLEEDPVNGAIYFTGGLWGGISCVTKVSSSDGSVYWSNGYDGFDSEQPFGIVINSDHLLLFDLVNGYYNQSYVQVTALNKTNGDTLFSKSISQTGDVSLARLYRGTQVVKLNNGHYRLCGPTTRYFQFPAFTGTIDLFHVGVIDLDANLNFVKAWGFKNRLEANGYNTKISLFPDGSGLFTMLDYVSSYNAETIICLFKDDQIYHQRKRIHANEGIPYEPASLQLADGGFLNIKLMGDSTKTGAQGSRIDYYRIHTSDTASLCIGLKDSSTSVYYFNFEPANRRINSVLPNMFRESRVKQFEQWNFSLQPDPACVVVSNCDTLVLRSTATTICPGNTITITIGKNKACGSLIPLEYDSSFVSGVTQLTDSTYRFHFNKPGKGFIRASLMGCVLRKDSVFIEVVPAVYSLNLGSDTVICPDNQIVLHARSGFASYQWQDGSTDSTFTVRNPGKFYVTAINGCGTVYSDTILVNNHPPIPLNVGADRTKCNTDTLRLTAPAGFINYNWSPAYGLSATTTQTVIANPMVDTSYVLKAELKPGCFAFDTVRVSVFRSPVIHLGADTSFCKGDSLQLNAGAGFVNYQWSTGGNAQTQTVYAAGNYSVAAVTNQGCTSYDTLRILNVFTNPVVSLDQQEAICTGSSKLLDAGSFASYLWNDGSTARTFTVNQPGVYAVTVKDNNGCFGRDTTRITTLLPLPAQFLPADTSICTYDQLTLKPTQGFRSYLWSNNSTNNTLTIAAPGLYWLTVTDQNNCVGQDSVLVSPKECLTGIYVPNAFTPNNDQLNDVVYPIIGGNVIQYRFSIFNRWGKLLFTTTERGKGWNGTAAGYPQDPGLFTWICTYQLEGGQLQTAKGFVMLMR